MVMNAISDVLNDRHSLFIFFFNIGLAALEIVDIWTLCTYITECKFLMCKCHKGGWLLILKAFFQHQ